MTGLENAIQQLALSRQASEAAKDAMGAALQGFRDSNAVLFEAEAQAKAMVADADAEVRRLALEAFAADNTNKRPAEGVGIRVTAQKDYDISNDAFDWAYEHKAALSLDVPKFKAMVDIGGIVPADVASVTVRAVPTVTIDRVLPIAETFAERQPRREKMENEAREEELRDQRREEELIAGFESEVQ